MVTIPLVTKHQHLVAQLFVAADKFLARVELVRVHGVEATLHGLVLVGVQVLFVETRRHGAAHLDALDFGQMAAVHEVQPIGLVPVFFFLKK